MRAREKERERDRGAHEVHVHTHALGHLAGESHIVGAGNAPGEPWFTWEMNALSRMEHAANIRKAALSSGSEHETVHNS